MSAPQSTPEKPALPGKARLKLTEPRASIGAVLGAVDYLRSTTTEGNQTGEAEDILTSRYQRLASQLARAWTNAGRTEALAELRPRLLVKYDYLPDKQPDAIRLLMEQMEAKATRLVN